MSYKQGEADILTLLHTLDDWNATNSVSVANDRNKTSATLVNSGKDYKYLFLSPGVFQSEFASIDDSFVLTGWQTEITLVVFDRAGGPAPEADLVDLRQSIMDLLDSHFQADSDVVSIAKIVQGERIESWRTKATGKTFYTTTMICLWQEDRELTQLD